MQADALEGDGTLERMLKDRRCRHARTTLAIAANIVAKSLA
jgi:hypothetical protein